MQRDVSCCCSIHLLILLIPFHRFLHASLQLQALRECTSRRDVEKALTNFPVRIADVYIATWNRIKSLPSQRPFLAIRALLWVTYAHRTLTIAELRHAIAVSSDTFKFDRTETVPIETLVSVCCGLLAIEKETNVVRLVREYLICR